MARGQTNKLYRTFAKGLITEAGFLTYPEDASSDELNTVIHRRGNRSRRLGLDYEPDSTGVPLDGYDSGEIVTEYMWRAVANKAPTNFLTVQVGDVIHFFDTATTPITDGKKSFTVNLNDYKAPTATVDKIRTTNVQMTAGKGYLFIVQEHIEPIVVDYDPETDTIAVIKVLIQVRDFDGVNDGLANDEEPSTLSKEHHYNLRNQGWVAPGSVPASSGGSGGSDGGTPGVGQQQYINPYTGQEIDYTPGGKAFENMQEV